MTKAKFLMMSIVFALVYITCDMFFIFYIADKTDQSATPQENTQYSMQRSHISQSQVAFAGQPSGSDYTLRSDNRKATIIE